jgi:hypothetical protein
MMHGHEKSDSVIVAVKPANKAEHSAAEQSTAELFAAEPAEPRAETKRNAGQQSTCGTQRSREHEFVRILPAPAGTRLVQHR